MKLIFVTGWVISGLGKGITAASIGRLMKSSWYKVVMAKMDPYINIDAGTMSPYEHGETYVTTDGFETDLDLWHYERYIDEELTRKSSITTAQIYLTVIEKERKGEYLGKNVQVIPHITNEIKDRIKFLAKWNDIAIIEIWGTVWDIEWPHFLEAMRQLKQEMWKENVLFIHVAPIIKISVSGEMKTKAIQHSIIKLRELGIQTDILMCRTEDPIDQNIKKKLALFCDIPETHIIEGKDQNIYQVPSAFKQQKLDQIITKKFFGEAKESDILAREDHVFRLMNPKKEITIAIAGKYTYLDDCYISVLESLKHAWAHFHTKINIHWIDTEELEKIERETQLDKVITEKNIKWILVPGGFGKRGVEGMINIANYARTKKIPYLWICLGLQIATIGFAREVCNIKWAHSTEIDPQTNDPIITIMEDQKTIENKWWTMRLWSYPAILKQWSKTLDLYQKYYTKTKDRWNVIQERHRHRYEVNPQYHEILENNWLIISGKSPDGKLVEFIEITDHPYFLATQAHPEMKSRLNKPHPLFLWLIEASIKERKDWNENINIEDF